MKELLDLAFSGANLVPAVLGAISIFYWLLVMIGLFDFQSLDADVDLHADVHADVHADLHADASGDLHAHSDIHTGGDSSGIGIKGVMTFFNLGKVPLMIILSFVSLFWWAGSVTLTHYLNLSLGVALLMLIPLFLLSLLISKFFTAPFGRLFEKMNQIAAPFEAVGRYGEITIEFEGKEMGQMRIKADEGWVNLNVKSTNGAKYLRGEQVVITEYLKTQNYYLIEPLNLD